MIDVLVVDDHDLIRAGIARMLQDDVSINVIGESDSGENAIDSAQSHKPDVVLMDIKMPGIGGIEATRLIKKVSDDIKVVVVSALTDSPSAQRVLDSGASAYVSKNSHISEMIKAVKKVHAGERYISPDIAQNMALNESSNDPFSELSSREKQIAEMIMECRKVQEISDVLCLSPKTVNSYRYRVFEKLGVTSDVGLTLMAVKHGLLEVDATE
ncbi:DNA-binding response regulator [Oleiphilus sp. HI0009]|uniref:response regulator n=1 Tax=Oleiphilus sp. HI0125 TaxID=1822266 RepID=UPI0007C240A8|nr:response regulator [Oleiphilus sp. HI0125]KZX82255.1 DNA-binding response regulator [Oleiphilus sp. HI0009]KZZ60788.1 DNA-binding response regulator [Oleiphilus sp. HI0125]